MVQVVAEVESSFLAARRHLDALKLLQRVIKAAPELVRPHVAATLKALLPRCDHPMPTWGDILRCVLYGCTP